MAIIEWTEEQFGTHIGETDQQHQKIFDMLNALHDALPNADRQAVGEQLDGFLSFVAEHFQTEERLLKDNAYPQYEAHKKEHDDLLQKAGEIKKKFDEGAEDVTQDTTIFVRDWLTNHIPKIDKPYGPFLNEKGVS